ncbi:MAG: dephospho-CoA kinase [Elusimicrobiaceae bacterium]|nr:dephospho-CoA kinase [Elusimicrobiaceae bacterium]
MSARRPRAGGVFPAGKIMVGLTGTPASGKSAVAARLAQLGALAICADTLAKEELARGGAGWRYVERNYPCAVGPDGDISRTRLADLIFKDPAARRGLEAAVHPAVIGRAKDIAGRASEKMVVFDAPLLFESGMTKDWFDAVVSVSAGAEIRLARALARGWSEEEFERRSAAQLSGEEKNSLSDFVVVNTGTLTELYALVDGIYKELSETGRN